MTNNIYHTNTTVKLISPLGDDHLQFRSMRGREAISKLFKFNITCSTIKSTITPQQLIGKSITLCLDNIGGEPRYFNGVALGFSTVRTDAGLFYKLKVQPKLALLQYRVNSRIFQNKTIKQIVEQILKESDIKFDTAKVVGAKTPLEYCVQYRESDLHFITRLLANAGIFYFFQHAKEKHTLVLADGSQAYSQQEKKFTLANPESAGITDWSRHHSFFSGKLTYGSHDFMNPQKNLQVSTKATATIANNSNYEIYQFPNDYLDTTSGNQLIRRRMEALENQLCHTRGTSNYPHLLLTQKISLDSEQFPDEKGNRYVITAITHKVSDEAQKGAHDDHHIYHNRFKCIPEKIALRPDLNVKKPTAPSTQLAVITGPAGKEIHTDKYGRMKVQFLWDREGKKNENSSCWIRAVQHWDGLFRIGTPVLIGFIDGDVDKPIILGPVYNANLMPIASLATEQTQSTLQRRHTKKETEKKYNHIRFDDKDAAQKLSIYASKDMLTEIEQDFTQDVKKGNYVLKVKGNVTIQAEGNIVMDSKKSITIKAADSINLSAKKNIVLEAGLALQQKAGNKLTQKAVEILQQADAKVTSKAALQQVEASGILTLKGGLIKEN